jgi:predicted 2-oxoglutarate/Fe(II)-dependent dioxygenase YbiX
MSDADVRVFVAPDFLDQQTCRRIREAMDAGDIEPAEILDEGIDLDADVRRAANIDVSSEVLTLVESALDAVRDRVGAFHRVALDAREGASFLRYPPGGFYRAHRDRAASNAWPDAARRRIAVVAFLNADFSGGELRLHPDGAQAVTIRPVTGTLIAFDAGVLHEVLPVVGSSRDTVVDWYYEG